MKFNEYEFKIWKEIHFHLEKWKQILLKSNDFITTLIEIKFALSKILYIAYLFANDELINAKREERAFDLIQTERVEIMHQNSIINDYFDILDLIYNWLNEYTDGETLINDLSLNNWFDHFENPLSIMFETMEIFWDWWSKRKVLFKDKLVLVQKYIFIESSYKLIISILKVILNIPSKHDQSNIHITEGSLCNLNEKSRLVQFLSEYSPCI